LRPRCPSPITPSRGHSPYPVARNGQRRSARLGATQRPSGCDDFRFRCDTTALRAATSMGQYLPCCSSKKCRACRSDELAPTFSPCGSGPAPSRSSTSNPLANVSDSISTHQRSFLGDSKTRLIGKRAWKPVAGSGVFIFGGQPPRVGDSHENASSGNGDFHFCCRNRSTGRSSVVRTLW
jgi:hypothetical protein